MPVRDILTRDVQPLVPYEACTESALRMRHENIGSLPIAEGNWLEGYVTDRDLLVRGLAQGFSGDTQVHYCFEDVEEVATNMAQNQVRRLPVISREKRLLGIVALGDIATEGKASSAEEALEGVSKPEQ